MREIADRVVLLRRDEPAERGDVAQAVERPQHECTCELLTRFPAALTA